MNKLKKILLYLEIYGLFLLMFYGVSPIFPIIGCGLNNCYNCCINQYLYEILPSFDFFVYMNYFALPSTIVWVLCDLYEEMKDCAINEQKR